MGPKRENDYQISETHISNLELENLLNYIFKFRISSINTVELVSYIFLLQNTYEGAFYLSRLAFSIQMNY